MCCTTAPNSWDYNQETSHRWWNISDGSKGGMQAVISRFRSKSTRRDKNLTAAVSPRSPACVAEIHNVFKLFDGRPGYEEVKLWAESFEHLMTNKNGRILFGEFLKREYADENILFWQACEELKLEVDSEKVTEKARIIYEDFISILSPKEVSLDSRVRESINDKMLHPNASTFDDAQKQIFTLMQRDSYPRFLQSKLYLELVQSFTEVHDL